MNVLPLKKYIEEYYGDTRHVTGAKQLFADVTGVTKQQVNKWLTDGWYVLMSDGSKPQLMSPKREAGVQIPTFKRIFQKCPEGYFERPFDYNASPTAYVEIDFNTGHVDVKPTSTESDLEVDARQDRDEIAEMLDRLASHFQRVLALRATLVGIGKGDERYAALSEKLAGSLQELKSLLAMHMFEEDTFIPDYSTNKYLPL